MVCSWTPWKTKKNNATIDAVWNAYRNGALTQKNRRRRRFMHSQEESGPRHGWEGLVRLR